MQTTFTPMTKKQSYLQKVLLRISLILLVILGMIATVASSFYSSPRAIVSALEGGLFSLILTSLVGFCLFVFIRLLLRQMQRMYPALVDDGLNVLFVKRLDFSLVMKLRDLNSINVFTSRSSSTLMSLLLVLGLVCFIAFPAAAQLQLTLEGPASTTVPSGSPFVIKAKYSYSSTTNPSISGVTITMPLPDYIDPRIQNPQAIFVTNSVHSTGFTVTPAIPNGIDPPVTGGGYVLTINFANGLNAGATGEIPITFRSRPGYTPNGQTAAFSASMQSTSPVSQSVNAPSGVTMTFTAGAQFSCGFDLFVSQSNLTLDRPLPGRIGFRYNVSPGVLNHSGLRAELPVAPGAIVTAIGQGGAFDAGNNKIVWNLPALTSDNFSNDQNPNFLYDAYNLTFIITYPSGTFTAPSQQLLNPVLYGTPLGGGGEQVVLQNSCNKDITLQGPGLGGASCQIVSRYQGRNFIQQGGGDGVSYIGTLENNGTTTLSNYIVTVQIPKETKITKISPQNLLFDQDGFYTVRLKDKNGVYTTVAGSPFSTSVPPNSGTAFINNGDGDGSIAEIEYNFGAVDPGFSGEIAFEVRPQEPDRDGNAWVLSQTQPYTVRPFAAQVTYTSGGTPGACQTSMDLELRPGTIQLYTFKSLNNAAGQSQSTFIPGERMQWSLGLPAYGAGIDLTDFVMADLLPAQLRYDGFIQPTGQGSSVVPAITPDVIDNYQGTGRQLVRFRFTQANTPGFVIKKNTDWKIEFYTRVKAGTPTGSYQNDVNLFSNQPGGNNELCGPSGPNSPESGFPDGSNPSKDVQDLDGDGDVDEYLCQTRTPYSRIFTVAQSAALESVKWVKGECDTKFTKYPEFGATVPGGAANYRLVIINLGNVPQTNIKVLDILPYIGDVSVISSTPRLTQWQPNLATAITASPGVTVEYSTVQNPERTEFDASTSGNATPNWSTTPPGDLTTVRTLRFDYGSTVLAPGDSIVLTWNMIAPIDAPTNNEIAWNSFAFKSTRTDDNSNLLPAEPNKVGIQVKPNPKGSIGNYVWMDSNNDGDVDAGEMGLNGIVVELWSPGGDNTIGGGDDTKITETVTVNNSLGEPGNYLFPNLNSGSYYVKFPTSVSQGTKNLVSPQALGTTDNTSVANQTIGNSPLVVIDVNGSGLAKDNILVDAGYKLQCVSPSATFTPTAPTCTGALANNNGKITFATATNVTNFGISTAGAVTYNGPAYPATTFTAIGQDVSTTIPNTGGTYIVRVFNGAAGCFVDVPVMVAAVTCGSSTTTCKEFIYVNEVVNAGRVHKFDVTSTNGVLTEVLNGGNVWYPGSGVTQLTNPHGLGVDRNGYLYIGSNFNSPNQIRRLDCAGSIAPSSTFNIPNISDLFNIDSYDGFIYSNGSGDRIYKFDPCTGAQVGYVQLGDGSEDWGFSIGDNGRFYVTNNSGKIWVFTPTAANFTSNTTFSPVIELNVNTNLWRTQPSLRISRSTGYYCR